MPKSTSLHDCFFKNVFQYADCVTSLFRVGAPDALFNIIDWPTLELRPTALLAPQLTEKLADLVFSGECQGQRQASADRADVRAQVIPRCRSCAAAGGEPVPALPAEQF